MILKKLPLCPSQNKQLTISRGRFIKTTAARFFDQKIVFYKIKNNKLIEEIKSQIKQGDILKVDCYFVFDKKRIFTKKNELKKIDSDNLLKSTRDALAKIIEYDDKYFVSGIVERLWCEDASEEQAIIKISKYNIKSLKEFNAEIAGEFI